MNQKTFFQHILKQTNINSTKKIMKHKLPIDKMSLNIKVLQIKMTSLKYLIMGKVV